eukprot:scaffold22310_cov59-Phaeocystis_antarctica.AAC.5
MRAAVEVGLRWARRLNSRLRGGCVAPQGAHAERGWLRCYPDRTSGGGIKWLREYQLQSWAAYASLPSIVVVAIPPPISCNAGFR